MNKLSFKVYLINEELNKRVEVRRFCLDVSVAKNFEYLREKLQYFFPELHEKHFIVTWKGKYPIPSLFTLFSSRLDTMLSLRTERTVTGIPILQHPATILQSLHVVAQLSKSISVCRIYYLMWRREL